MLHLTFSVTVSPHPQIISTYVFDVEMEDFHHKAQLVARGHATKASATHTYASVMS
jgi:hypothetical protein